MKLDSDSWLPTSKDLESWLDLNESPAIDDLIQKALLSPLTEFLGRPSKKFRSELVQLAYDLLSGPQENKEALEKAMHTLEAIHAASLVVDDIQDNSEFRRGRPTLHKTHGLAVALNSANWLYFWPLEQIQEWNVPLERKAKATRACHRALIKAHAGQALDVGTPMSQVPQGRVRSICLASLELKTGALTGLAMELGGILAGVSPEEEARLLRFGCEFGIALQMFDDLGNLKEKLPADPKRFEDLKGDRPSWVWASAAEQLSENDYREFVQVVNALPDEKPVNDYFRSALWIQKAQADAGLFLDETVKKFLQFSWNPQAKTALECLTKRLKGAYG